MMDASAIAIAAVERELAEMTAVNAAVAANLVRVGLRIRGDDGVSQAVARVETAVAELRALVA
jgi:hypothetical protein